MSVRGAGRIGVLAGVLGLALVACFEDATSPASCPDFCPSGQIVAIETLLATSVSRDSAFRGYIEPEDAAMLPVASLPQVDSRPIFEMFAITPRLRIDTGSDTTTGPIVVDSMRLTLSLVRRDTAAHNLRLAFYRLPLGLDSTSSFAGLAPAFAGQPARVVNLDSLLALPGRRDATTGDTVLSVDSVRNAVTIAFKFDTTQVPFLAADSGRVALGVRVTADSLASLALGSREGAFFGATGPKMVWFNRVDSLGKLVPRDSQLRLTRFDGFVFDPPAAPLDSNLTLGGVPSSRALLRFALPRYIRDSSQIIRATLILVPVAPVLGTHADSFFLNVRRVLADIGSKSPADTLSSNSKVFRPGVLDSIRVEVTPIFRSWQADTTKPMAAYLLLLPLDRRDTTNLNNLETEGTAHTTLRVYSSRTAAFRPGLVVTYVPRFKFGAP